MKVRQIVWEPVKGKIDYEDAYGFQLKYDGSQYHLHIKNGKAYALTSRRISKKTKLYNEKLDNFPQLKKMKFPFKKETILVGEVSAEHLKDDFDNGKIKLKDGRTATWSKRANYVASIMNSNPDSVPKHNLKYIVFDILMLNGKNISKETYYKKYLIITKHLPQAGTRGQFANVINSPVLVVTFFKGEFNENELLKKMVKEVDAEGLIIRNLFSNKLKKVKRQRDADCIIIGYTKGKGKYKKLFGAIKIGVLKNGNINHKGNRFSPMKVSKLIENGKIISVGQISGITDELRSEINKNRRDFLGMPIHVEYMQWTGKAMRHPRVGNLGIRKDKQIKRCNINQFGE